MSSKIQRSMVLVLSITLLLSFAFTTLVLYQQTLEDMKREVRQEVKYIEKALEISEKDYLSDLDEFIGGNRLMLIEKDGTVVYDSSTEKVENVPNHGSREEVLEALEHGEGEALRRSDTFKKQTYYYAKYLSSGKVLRISKTTDTVFSTMADLLPSLGIMAVVMITIALIMAKWQTNCLIKPINEIDLEHPTSHIAYEELLPLLQSIENQNQEKAKVEQMRKEFSANVSHELKTPLTSISGYAELMMNGLVRPEDIQTFAGIIYNEGNRMLTLVDDIIRLSRLDEESIELEKEKVDFFDMAMQICQRLSLKAKKQDVHMEVTGEHVTYVGIRQILEEMIYNIADNAIKYNQPGGYVKIWTGAVMGVPKVIIEDNGIGIPEESLERIFERFYRVDKSHSKETGGTGLGLSIVKHGAILHNARVNVESTLGKGTKMELVFEPKRRQKESRE